MRYLAVFLLLVLSACSLFGPSGPSYVVFFQERSAQLDAPARRVVAQAAQRTNADPAARVEVSGYTDSAGSPQADVLLSQQRAQAVADALVASGVAADRLVRKGQGQTGGNPALQADVSRLRSATSATSATSEDYGPAPPRGQSSDFETTRWLPSRSR
jgi:outer membrane protein OmpA-like peptidoglycan-associated protein